MSIIFNGQADPRTFKEMLSACLTGLLEKDADVIYLDADLMSCIGMNKYAEDHPDRAVNCGIAEANMAGVAAGLAAAGFKPICHTFGPFASRRCYDQVFLSGGYAHNDITMIGTDPGVSAAFNGGTHMPFEDIALYRAIPGATVIDMTDTAMLENLLPKVVELPGVKYMRMSRKSNIRVYGDETDFQIGKGVVCREGKDATIIACGMMVGKALRAAEILAEKGISAAVIDMFTVKPLDEALVIEWAERTGCIVTAENHNRVGGLYSAVADCIVKNKPVPVGYVAVEDEFGEVGPQDYLEQRFDLTAEHIVRSVEETIAKKK